MTTHYDSMLIPQDLASMFEKSTPEVGGVFASRLAEEQMGETINNWRASTPAVDVPVIRRRRRIAI